MNFNATFRTAMCAIAIAVLAGCNGDDGDQGPAGPQGAPGEQGVPGNDGTNGANGANGSNGTNGADGADGNNGINGLVEQTELPEGDVNCPNGGVRIDTGLDVNGNGLLDANEITETQYICVPDPITPPESVAIGTLRLIGEAVIPTGQDFEGTTVGGLSSIDYVNGEYLMISDDQGSDADALNGPVRMYSASIDFDANGISSAAITAVTEILNSDGSSFIGGQADPEALRLDPASGNIVWTSEGFVNSGVDPFVREFDTTGAYVRDFNVPNIFLVNANEGEGPRNNTSFEGLSLSVDGNGYWVAMEGALGQDGEEAQFIDDRSPARVAYIDRETGEFGRQFAIELDPVLRLPAQPGFQFSVSGIVEILETGPDEFLLLERSFATNYVDGGNNVKIYKIDASNATDVSGMTSLDAVTAESNNVIFASKTELFDFESVRGQLTANMVDNIEGITFGPDLPNGNKSLVLVADDNFALFSPQINQIVAFEVLAAEPEPEPEMTISSLSFIGEQVLPQELYEDTTVGGLSGIDYWNGTYYLISDDNGSDSDAFEGQARAYTATLNFDNDSFDSVELTGVIPLYDLIDDDGNAQPYAAGGVDPEAMRIDPNNGNLIWVNEGQINSGIDPEIREIGTSGELVRTFPLPEMFQIDDTGTTGPRHNVVFEGLSVNIDGDGFWVGMEGPLAQDGEEASLADTVSPVRVSLINRETGALMQQFAYELDSVTNRNGADTAFTVNGVVDVLEYARDQFLVLERSFVSGQADGGNDVKLYKVDASNATDVSIYDALEDATYTGAEKSLLLDFNQVRDQLSTISGVNIVDNLEGITFGPKLPNGNHSLVVVADNNFSAFGEQLNQFIVFEVNP